MVAKSLTRRPLGRTKGCSELDAKLGRSISDGDPNKVVQINDVIAATQASQVANETFTTIAGPVYGTVFRGVGFVE